MAAKKPMFGVKPVGKGAAAKATKKTAQTPKGFVPFAKKGAPAGGGKNTGASGKGGAAKGRSGKK